MSGGWFFNLTRMDTQEIISFKEAIPDGHLTYGGLFKYYRDPCFAARCAGVDQNRLGEWADIRGI